jgi:UDPglucose--hexose-1-phosphate uridylyltransferase
MNPPTGDWVPLFPGRTRRPWKGQTESAGSASVPVHDSQCYMCLGNARAGGEYNPKYTGTALQPSGEAHEEDVSGLLVASHERGISRVVCLSLRHDLTLAEMSGAELRAVVDGWTEHYCSPDGESGINSVLIFENRGAVMGASNPHRTGKSGQTPLCRTSPPRSKRRCLPAATLILLVVRVLKARPREGRAHGLRER